MREILKNMVNGNVPGGSVAKYELYSALQEALDPNSIVNSWKPLTKECDADDTDYEWVNRISLARTFGSSGVRNSELEILKLEEEERNKENRKKNKYVRSKHEFKFEKLLDEYPTISFDDKLDILQFFQSLQENYRLTHKKTRKLARKVLDWIAENQNIGDDAKLIKYEIVCEEFGETDIYCYFKSKNTINISKFIDKYKEFERIPNFIMRWDAEKDCVSDFAYCSEFHDSFLDENGHVIYQVLHCIESQEYFKNEVKPYLENLIDH